MTDEQAYETYCVGCWRETQCHENMNYCDKFLMATYDGFGKKLVDGFWKGFNGVARRCKEADNDN